MAAFKLVERLWPALIIVLVLLIIVGSAELVGSNLIDRTVTEMLIRIVLVVGVYIFMGNSGVVSFGHMAFAVIGAYAVVWQTCCEMLKPSIMPGLPDFIAYNSVPVLPAAIIAGLLAMIVAFLVSLIIMRLNGLAAGIATFSFLVIINVIYSNWQSVTRGTSSIIGIPVYVDAWVVLCWCGVTLFVAAFYQTSRFGLMLRASREDPVAAAATGINVTVQRIISFTISAFFCAVGGALYAHFLGAISVNTFYLDMTFMTLAMLVVGGSGSLVGVVFGVLLISSLREILSTLEAGVEFGASTLALPTGTQQIGLGLIMLGIIMFRPQGLFGSWEIQAPKWLRGRIASTSDTVTL